MKFPSPAGNKAASWIDHLFKATAIGGRSRTQSELNSAEIKGERVFKR